MLMSPSYAIMSAKISNMDYGGVDCQHKIKLMHLEMPYCCKEGHLSTWGTVLS